MERRGPKTLLNSAAVVSGDKQKELMLPGSLTGEPGYASILWADDQGISSEISRSLSFFNSSCGGRGVGVRCQQHPRSLGVPSLSSKSSGSRSGDRALRRWQNCQKRTMRRRRTMWLKTTWISPRTTDAGDQVGLNKVWLRREFPPPQCIISSKVDNTRILDTTGPSQ